MTPSVSTLEVKSQLHDLGNPSRRILRQCFVGQPIGLPAKGRFHRIGAVALLILGQ